MDKKTTLKDLYSFPGFRAYGALRPHPEHAGAMILGLRRSQKKRHVPAVVINAVGMTAEHGLFETWMPAISRSTLRSRSGGLIARGARP